MTVLRGMTWRHRRGLDSLVAASAAFHRVNPGVEVVWDARSQHDFEAMPLPVLAESYDVMAIDHPLVGHGIRSGALVALDDLVGDEVLAGRRAASVGPSTASYEVAGRQWALPVDAAAQVCAAREDLLAAAGLPLPRTWDDVDAVADALGNDAVVLPANPVHLLGATLTLCGQLAGGAAPQPDGRPAWWPDEGVDAELLGAAVERVRSLLARSAPASPGLDPIGVLEAMSAGDTYVLCPLVFGYITYAHADREHPLRFTAPPSPDGAVTGSLTGGVGLAVSASCREPALAAQVIAFVTSPGCQTGPYLAAGGQPADRAAWTAPELDAGVTWFFSSTLPTLDAGFLRPRGPAYPDVQRAAAETVHRLLGRGAPTREVAGELAAVLRRATAPVGVRA